MTEENQHKLNENQIGNGFISIHISQAVTRCSSTSHKLMINAQTHISSPSTVPKTSYVLQLKNKRLLTVLLLLGDHFLSTQQKKSSRFFSLFSAKLTTKIKHMI